MSDDVTARAAEVLNQCWCTEDEMGGQERAFDCPSHGHPDAGAHALSAAGLLVTPDSDRLRATTVTPAERAVIDAAKAWRAARAWNHPGSVEAYAYADRCAAPAAAVDALPKEDRP